MGIPLRWTQVLDVTGATVDQFSVYDTIPSGTNGIWVNLKATSGSDFMLTLVLTSLVETTSDDVPWKAHPHSLTNPGTLNLVLAPSPVGVQTSDSENDVLLKTGIIAPVWRVVVRHGNAQPVDYTVQFIYPVS